MYHQSSSYITTLKRELHHQQAKKKQKKEHPFHRVLKKSFLVSPSSHFSFCYLVTQLKKDKKVIFQNDTGL